MAFTNVFWEFGGRDGPRESYLSPRPIVGNCAAGRSGTIAVDRFLISKRFRRQAAFFRFFLPCVAVK